MIAGKYVLERLLGQGGMGAVFAAKHVKLSKAVAIKIMLADTSNPEAAQRFINEGRAAANIQNEHVVRVDDVDEEMGYAYMVLELLDGEDLSQLLEREPSHRLSPHVAVGYVLEALKGVMQAHAIGIVHRDLKPSNLFLAKRKDGSVVVKVLDFGISKAQGSSALAASPRALTSTKEMLGSPLYMSPEQLRSSKSVDHRADIWAMGVILYELMTGRLPFMGDSLGELFANILETDPTPLRNFNPDVAPALEQIVLSCLQRRPEQRFQTAAELAQALAPFASPQPGYVASSPLGGTALLGHGVSASLSHPHATTPGQSGSSPAIGAITPGTPSGMVRPPLPSTGASTGSGPRVIGGTVALGAVTPQGLQQTGSGWQSTGTGTGSIPKSKTPLIIGAAVGAVLLLLGIVGLGLIVKSKPSGDPGTPASIAASAPPPPSVIPSASPPVETAPAPTTTEPASTAAATSATTAPSAPATVATHTTAAPKTPKSPSQPTAQAKVDPPKPADPPKTTPTAKPNNGGLQNAR